jgi:guanylate kinase
MQREGDFLESAEVFGRDAYGTPKAPVLDDMANGRVVLLDIDVQGAAQVRRAVPEACMIFVLPPDEDTLRARLTSRGRDDAIAIERRLAEARTEIEAAQAPGLYDCFVVNDDLDKATQSVLDMVNRHRRQAAEA